MKNTNRKNSIAYSDKRIKQIVLSMAEIKRFVLLSTANIPAAAGAVFNLTNGIVQGDDLNQRSGGKIKLAKQVVRVRFSAVVANQTVRFILVKDNTNRGTTPTVTEILNTASLMSQYNPTTMLQSRFKILRDINLSCSINGEAIKEQTVTLASKYPVFYNASTAIAAANGPGATFLLVIGETASGLFDFSYEAHYSDM